MSRFLALLFLSLGFDFKKKKKNEQCAAGILKCVKIHLYKEPGPLRNGQNKKKRNSSKVIKKNEWKCHVSLPANIFLNKTKLKDNSLLNYPPKNET